MKIGYDAKRIFHNTTGLGNYSRDLVRILSSYFPENQYYLYNPKPAKVNRLELRENMIVREPDSFWSKKVPALWRYKNIVKDLTDDQIEIFHGLSAELPVGIDKTSIKTVVTIHDLIFMRHPEWYKPVDRKIYYKKFLHAVKTADKIVAISENTKKDILEYAQISPKKIEVIYQGCHNVFKYPASENIKEKIKNKFNLPHHFILNVGTIEPRKNAFSIVKAIRDSHYNLVLVGRQTAYADKIKKYIKKYEMTHRVFFLEGLQLEELAALYQMADIFIYPSFYEGFGIPIIEALYSQTPVITNKHGVFPEAGGRFSYYLDDVTDINEIKQLIDHVYHSPNRNRIYDAYEFVQQFNDDMIARNWMQLYKKLHKN
jgi:glycosyltransferase involved in cell wall biosynthesis